MSHPANAGLLGLRTGVGGVLIARGRQKAFGRRSVPGQRFVLGRVAQ